MTGARLGVRDGAWLEGRGLARWVGASAGWLEPCWVGGTRSGRWDKAGMGRWGHPGWCR